MALPFVTPIAAPGPAGNSVTKVTKYASELITRSYCEGFAFKVTKFAIGTGGFRSDNPLMPSDVDINATQLINEIYRGDVDAFEKPVYVYGSPTPNSIAIASRITPLAGLSSYIGELGLFATIVKAPALRAGGDGQLVGGNLFRSTLASFVAGDAGKSVKIGTARYLITEVHSPTETLIKTPDAADVTLNAASGVSWQIPDIALGDEFLFSITHFPIITIFDNQMSLHRTVLSF